MTAIAITGGTVLPMDGRRLERHTIHVDDGRIVAVDEAQPDGATVVDASGRYVMPGLADMHCHLGDEGQWTCFFANGVTTIRDMFGGPLSLRLSRTGGAPRVVACSPIVDGPVGGGPRYPGFTVVDEPAVVRDLVARFADEGYAAFKVYSALSPECFEAACATGFPVVGHVPAGVTWERAAALGMRSFEHLLEVETGHLLGDVPAGPYTERFLALDRVLDRDAVRRAAAELARRDVWSCPTLAVNDRIVEGRADPDDPALRYVPSAARARWARSRMRRPDAIAPERFEAGLDARNRMHREVVAILETEGAPLMTGTDAGSNSTVPGFAIHDELEAMTEAGLSAERVLRTATVEAARFLGEPSDLIAHGRRADLLVLDADPTRDLDTLRRPHAVIANGVLHTRAALDAALEQRAATVEAVMDLPDGAVGPMSTRSWFGR